LVDWTEILLDASKEVQRTSRQLEASRSGRSKVGIGASGDETLLVDSEAESAALSVISQVGNTRIVTEEKGELGSNTARWTVVIDPIDGSSNFERGLPFYCTSMAVVEGKSIADVKFAVVRNLVTGEVYQASRGGGARKGKRDLHCSSVEKLEEAVVMLDASRTTARILTQMIPLSISVKRLVHFGANALETCLFAEGKVDGIVDIRRRMRIVDFAGSFLIAAEAGATITDETGAVLKVPIGLGERLNVVAGGNRGIHKQLLVKLA
jgi:myo-inositol-1(or 4)-monophosphatase